MDIKISNLKLVKEIIIIKKQQHKKSTPTQFEYANFTGTSSPVKAIVIVFFFCWKFIR